MLRSVMYGLRRLLRRSDVERELDEELSYHLHRSAAEYETAGLTRREAQRRALLEFGGVERYKEASRDASGVRLIEDARQDVRFAARSLRRAPAFTAAALFTLALGIGATTAMFSVVDGVLLRPLAYADADRLVRVWQNDRNSGTQREPSSLPDYFDLADRSTAFELLAGHVEDARSVTREGGFAERVTVVSASHTLFPLLSTAFHAGRGFTAEEDMPGGAPVAVVNEDFWRARSGDPRAAVGATLELDGVTHQVIGVVRRGHAYPHERVDVWVPLARDASSLPREMHTLDVTARLRPDVPLAAAQADVTRIMAALEAEYPETNTARGGFVEPVADVLFAGMRAPLLVLLGAVGVLLVIACSNVANLLLARSGTRAREVAARTALGAGRARLLRQFVTEALLLTLLAGAAGLALAWGAVRALGALVPAGLPRFDDVGVDPRVLAFTAGVCLLVAVPFGILPALRARRGDVHGSLRGAGGGAGGRGGTAGRGSARLRRALVAAQVALSVGLLVGAGLLLRSFATLTAVDTGVRAEGVLKAEFQLPTTRYPQDFRSYPDWPAVQRFYAELLADVSRLPGVEAAALSSHHPFAPGYTNSFRIVGDADVPGQPEIGVRPVTAGYLEAVGARLVTGRAIDARDDAAAPPVLLINEAAARLHFPGRDPIGRRIAFWGAEREIIGVIADQRYAGLAEAPPAAVYPPLQQTPMHGAVLFVRTAGPPSLLADGVRAAVRRVDPDVALFGVEPLTATHGQALARERFTAVLLALFAVAALLLAVAGVHGMIAYSVAQRTRELGIRAALGATPRELRGLFVREGMGLAAAGLAAGLAAALAGSTLLAGLLHGVEPHDPLTYGAAATVITAAAALACWLPARRATAVQPLETLRGE